MIGTQKGAPKSYRQPDLKSPPPFNIEATQAAGQKKKRKKGKKNNLLWNCCCTRRTSIKTQPVLFQSGDLCRVETLAKDNLQPKQVLSAPVITPASCKIRVEKEKPRTLHIPRTERRDQEWSYISDVSVSDNYKNRSQHSSRRGSASSGGFVETQVFWETLWPDGWRTFSSEIGKGIEKVYQIIMLGDYDPGENYSQNWWRDSGRDDAFVYSYKHYKVSPMFMLQRDMNSGVFAEVRRKKVEVQTSGYRRKMSVTKSESRRGSSGYLIPKASPQSVYIPPQPNKRRRKRKKKKSGKKKIYRDTNYEHRNDQRPRHKNSSKRSNVCTINFQDYRNWTTAHVCQWLRILNFPEYCTAVQEEGVTGKDLAHADVTYLVEELDMTVDHAIHILGALKGIASGFSEDLDRKTSSRSTTPYGYYQQHHDKNPASTMADIVAEKEFLVPFRRSILLQPREHAPSETPSALSSMSGPPPFDRLRRKRSKSESLRHKLMTPNPQWEKRVKRASSPTQPKCAYVAVNPRNSAGSSVVSQPGNRLYDNFVVKEQFAHDLCDKNLLVEDNKCEQTKDINLEAYPSSIFEDEEIETSFYGDEETMSSANISGIHTKLPTKVYDPNQENSNKGNSYHKLPQLPSNDTENSKDLNKLELARREKYTEEREQYTSTVTTGAKKKVRHAKCPSRIESVLASVNISKLREDTMDCFEDCGETKQKKRLRGKSVGCGKTIHKRLEDSRNQSFDFAFTSQEKHNEDLGNTDGDLKALISELDTVNFKTAEISDELTAKATEDSPE